MKLYDNDSFRETFMKRVYELLADDPDNYRANEIIDLFDNAPEFNPPNEPLTIEQLREMDGEPVYVHNLFPAKRKFEWQWALVCKERGNAEATTYTYRFLDYGKTWIAYRRPLGGEEDQHGNHRL